MNFRNTLPKKNLSSNYTHKNDWFYEGNVSRCIVQHLITNGYTIIRDNSDNCSARGEDIIAVSPQGIKEIIEVKGYPTIYHTKGEKIGQPKKTKPKLQAKHWFGEALLSSFNNYGKHTGKGRFCLGLGFPLIDRYIELTSKVNGFFTAFKIDIVIYFVDSSGNVTVANIGKGII